MNKYISFVFAFRWGRNFVKLWYKKVMVER